MINVNSTFDLEYWATRLRISVRRLRNLVLSKGPQVEAVVAEIEKEKSAREMRGDDPASKSS
jgi:hypothetical protein